MKDHPLTPMRDSNLMRLLAPQTTRDVGLVNRLTVAQGPDALRSALKQLSTNGTAHVVVDAVENADLDIIAQGARHLPLLTGGSAVAMPLPALFAADGLLDLDAEAAHHTAPAKAALILSGSCSAMTNAQVAAYIATGAPAYRVDPLALAESGAAPVLDWLKGQDLNQAPLIYATADPASVKAAQEKLGSAKAGEMVESLLASCAVAARDAGARRIVVAGGETSGAVTKALQTNQLDIGPEIAPGVPWTFCTSDGHAMAITLKSGNFGSETFFAHALETLDAL